MEGTLIDFSMNMVYQILIQAVTVLFFFIIIKKFFYDKVTDILDKREENINQEFSRADEAKEDAIALKEEYEERLNNFKEETITLKREAEEEAKKESDLIIKQAQSQAVEIKNKANDDIAKAKENAMKDIKQDIIDISMDITNKVIEEALDDEKQANLINKAIESIDEV